ncbi:hypothetical protein TanjilG_05284 [Lupinus angustifolius]|uniref:Senescence regulator n=1 Tax=Lupinus angustifolius TaxID=3871 RepID=A0A4P1QW52_LUPAN|nr:PREDICTED: uncharacterized protein LOC109329019 [Lupinus angustifolius]OIV95736.1 hypothetical protein TanjilG_05284 [Lupinus angustifolius]
MAEEFLESEVIFSDHYAHRFVERNLDDMELGVVPQKKISQGMRCTKSSNGGNKKMMANSLPVNIPERMLRWSMEEEDDDGEMMVPPHVMVERRISGGKMAYSVCTGNGRTLKGRDLSQVRNTILRMTGFLEA